MCSLLSFRCSAVLLDSCFDRSCAHSGRGWGTGPWFSYDWLLCAAAGCWDMSLPMISFTSSSVMS